MRRQVGICATLLLIQAHPRVGAQTTAPSYIKREISAVKTARPPKLEAGLDDEVWKSATKAETFVDEQNGNAVTEQTTVYLLYDDKSIYVAFYCKDSQPNRIEARETVRDSKFQQQTNGDTEDNVEVDLDPFQGHHPEDRSNFSINALGTLSAHPAGGRANKVEWEGDWAGQVKRVSDGWTAVMRIPWSALNYPNSHGPTTLCINFTRFQLRTRLLSIWSNIGPQGFFDNDGRWTGVQPPARATRPRPSLLPYVLLSNVGTRPTLRTGLDVRYPVTPQLTAVGSINPEFSTVESAVASIQFSRSQQVVPESRPFFLEGSDNFNVSNVNIIGNYFFSNFIPGFDVGAKLYGKITPTDTLGFLEAVTFGSRNDLVMRYRHDLSATSQVGLFVEQLSATNDSNTVGMVSQDARRGKLEMNSQFALTGGHSSGGDAGQVAWLYEDKLILWALGYSEVSPIFRDADGYIPFVDYRGMIFLMQWGALWRKGPWRDFNFNLQPTWEWHIDGRPFQRGSSMNLSFDTRSDWNLGVNLNYNAFDNQTDSTWGLSLTRGATNRFHQWGIAFTSGIEADRPATFLGPFFSVRMLRKMDLTYNGAVQNLNGTVQQHIIAVNYELSPTRALGGRMVAQNGAVNMFLFYRNSGGKGINYYFVLGDPNAPKFVKQVQLKFIFAL